MPLKLYPPTGKKQTSWRIRGTYLGRHVERSARTGKRAIAAKVLKAIERQIERGEFSEPGEPTFASAAAAYMKAGGERTYLRKLLEHFGDSHSRKSINLPSMLALYIATRTPAQLRAIGKLIPRYRLSSDLLDIASLYAGLKALVEQNELPGFGQSSLKRFLPKRKSSTRSSPRSSSFSVTRG